MTLCTRTTHKTLKAILMFINILKNYNDISFHFFSVPSEQRRRRRQQGRLDVEKFINNI